MGDRMDELEARLQSLQPRAPSPGLKRNIAARLGEPSPGAARRARAWIIVGGLLAAGLAICVAVRWLSGVEPRPVSPAKIVSHQPSGPVSADDRPILSVYTAALIRSPIELDALLEKHARTVLPPERHPAGPGDDVFVRRPSL
jgi:hypothetical protein